MKGLLWRLGFAAILIGGGIAIADNYQATQGSGTTFGSKVLSAVNFPEFLVCDATTAGQCAAVSAGGAVKVDGSAVTQPISGSVTVSGTPNVNVSNANPNGTATAANSSPVVLPTAGTTGNIAANNTTAVVIKASAGTLFGVQLYGIGSVPVYLKIYNATSATCGSGTPVKRLMIPAASTAANGAGSNISFGAGIAFTTGITYCVTTGITDADTTAPAASTFLVNLDWN